jgi:hypothetical protein
MNLRLRIIEDDEWAEARIQVQAGEGAFYGAVLEYKSNEKTLAGKDMWLAVPVAWSND